MSLKKSKNDEKEENPTIPKKNSLNRIPSPIKVRRKGSLIYLTSPVKARRKASLQH